MIPERYYHGSSSASLVGVLDIENPELKSLGQLWNEGNVSYCGTLDQGISRIGISWRAICAFKDNYWDCAGDYALATARIRWNPKVSRKRVEKYQQDIERSERRVSELQDGKEDKRLSLEYLVDNIERRKSLIQIEERRQEKWEGLRKFDLAKMVRSPFPIVYELSPKRIIYARDIHSERAKEILFPENPNILIDITYRGLEGEVFIPDQVEIEDMILYVPQRKLSLVREAAYQQGVGANIGTFEELQGKAIAYLRERKEGSSKFRPNPYWVPLQNLIRESDDSLQGRLRRFFGKAKNKFRM